MGGKIKVRYLSAVLDLSPAAFLFFQTDFSRETVRSYPFYPTVYLTIADTGQALRAFVFISLGISRINPGVMHSELLQS